MVSMSGLEARFCRSLPWRRITRHQVIPRVAGRVEGPTVLEIGCGSGAMAAEVLRARPDIKRYVATDIDPAMVRAARRRLARFGGRAHVQLVDAAGLGFDDESFETVCSWLMLHHTIEWQRVIDDCVRVLRPGGRLIGYDLPDNLLGRTVHRVTRSSVVLVDPDRLVAHLDDLGLREVTTEPMLAGQTYRFEAMR